MRSFTKHEGGATEEREKRKRRREKKKEERKKEFSLVFEKVYTEHSKTEPDSQRYRFPSWFCRGCLRSAKCVVKTYSIMQRRFITLVAERKRRKCSKRRKEQEKERISSKKKKKRLRRTTKKNMKKKNKKKKKKKNNQEPRWRMENTDTSVGSKPWFGLPATCCKNTDFLLPLWFSYYQDAYRSLCLPIPEHGKLQFNGTAWQRTKIWLKLLFAAIRQYFQH